MSTLVELPGCELGHHGEELPFEAILRKSRLTNDPALSLLAQIVRALNLILTINTVQAAAPAR